MKKLVLFIILMMIVAFNSTIDSNAVERIPAEIAGTQFESAIDALMHEGIISGYPDGYYHPERSMNRAEACTIVVKALRVSLSEFDPAVFSDIQGYSWAAPYIGYAVENGIVVGYGDGTFKPNNPVTMNEMITMIVRVLDDDEAVEARKWPEYYITKAKELGLVSGIDLEKQYADRGSVAIMTYNFLNIIESETWNQYAILIQKKDITDGDYNRIIVMTQNGDVVTCFIKKSFLNYKKLYPGDILAIKLDEKNVIEQLIKKEIEYDGSGKFTEFDSYNGTAIDRNAVIFSFGLEKQYSSIDADFSTDKSDYAIKPLRLLRNVTTPAYYIIEKGKIKVMIVPTDVGYTGRAYGMILGTSSVSNIYGEAVGSVEFLISRDTIQIMTNGNPVLFIDEDYWNGDVFEIALRSGVAVNIAKAGPDADPPNRNNAFLELTDGFMEVTKIGMNYLVLSDMGESLIVEVADKNVVYEISYDEDIPDGYDPAEYNDIRIGSFIRGYDVTDNDEKSANIIVVK